MKQAIAALVYFTFCSLSAQTFTFKYYAPAEQVKLIDSVRMKPSMELGFYELTITSTNISKFLKVLPPNLKKIYIDWHDKSSMFYHYRNIVCAISKGKVANIEVQIINDTNGLIVNGSNFFERRYSEKYNVIQAFPSAFNNGTNGIIKFGEISAGEPKILNTILHELFHTQSFRAPDGNNSRYGKTDPIAISYGGDEGHFKNELLADQQAAMDEGFGNFWGSLVNPITQSQSIVDFNNNSPTYYLGSHSFLSGVKEMWDTKHKVLIDTFIKANTPTPLIFKKGKYTIQLTKSLASSGGFQARLYNYMDIPGKYLFHSEYLPEMYLNMFYKYGFTQKDTALNKIFKYCQYYSLGSSFQRNRYPRNMVVFLANELDIYIKKNPSKAQSTKEVFNTGLFALGLYDILMHFGMTDAELKKELELACYDIPDVIKLTKPLSIDQYFKMRGQLKTIVCPILGGDQNCAHKLDLKNIEDAVKELIKFSSDKSKIDEIIKI